MGNCCCEGSKNTGKFAVPFRYLYRMKKRTVLATYRAGYTDYDGLHTYSAMPNRNVTIDQLEPFLFLNHHGPQSYPPENKGLPFGPHPHKGFETVTIILEGDIVHQDSTGFKSTIGANGIQWMTAGNGIVHAETSSEEFKKNGGPIEVLQLWVNLPSRLKSHDPAYTGLQKEKIPVIKVNEGKVEIHAISGRWEDHDGAIQSLADIQLAWFEMKETATYTFFIEQERQILCYVIRGKVTINDEVCEMHDLVEFSHEGEAITITAEKYSLVLIGHALPQREPIAAHGPFVMNTMEEVRQAFIDYSSGKFGEIKD